MNKFAFVVSSGALTSNLFKLSSLVFCVNEALPRNKSKVKRVSFLFFKNKYEGMFFKV